MRKIILLTILGASFLAGCSTVKPVPYRNIASSQYMRENLYNENGKVPYRYATQVNWVIYTKAILPPIEIYRGADNQFDDLSEQDKKELVRCMQSKFSHELSKRFQLSTTPSANTLLIKLTLTGAAKTNKFIGPAAKFDIGGGIYNAIQSMRGGEGAFIGSVIYAAEIYDAFTHELLDAKIIKQYPNAYNVGSSFGALTAARLGIEKGAKEMAKQF